MSTMRPEPAPDTQKQLKVWVVLLFDGNDQMSHMHVFTFDSDMKAIEQWAKDKIASDTAVFSKNLNNKSLAQRHVIYGSDVDTLHLPRELRRLETPS